MRAFLIASLTCLYWGSVFSAPSLVLTNLAESEKSEKEFGDKHLDEPIIYQFDINSNISNRFATTSVTSKVKNAGEVAKEATFSVVLPEQAFISRFVLEIGGKTYEAYVKEKEEAKKIYNEAVQSGMTAGHVAVSARDSNRFTVSINVEPGSKASFILTYEELLKRKNDQYELVLNVHPGQIVKDMNIEVYVNESKPLKYVKTPSLRTGNEISKNSDKLDPSSDIQIINNNTAFIKFSPSIDKQKYFAKGLGTKENDGLAGQFVLQYDVERDPRNGEVLLKDGYFVHFFAPKDIEPLPKHVVFILDTSGSMYGSKLKQLKDAMASILDELKEEDTFHIIEFNTNVYVWNIDSESNVKIKIQNEKEPFEELQTKELPSAIPATKAAVTKGKAVIQKLTDTGMTNMLASIETALHLISVNSKNDKTHQPIIIFLTDGDPTIGTTNTKEIVNVVTRLNKERDHVPIFSLSFGDGADKIFLRSLSLNNLGFSRHIYAAGDASIQLQEFFKQISSPLLSNIHFEYVDSVKEVSKTTFPILFKGSEIVVAGRYDEGFDHSKGLIRCTARSGKISIPSVEETPVSSLERLWAYLTVKQKLEQREIAENKTQLTKEALDLALKYSFVTDVSSLVVVKPNQSSSVDTVDASKPIHSYPGAAFGLPAGRMAVSGGPYPIIGTINSVPYQSGPFAMSGPFDGMGNRRYLSSGYRPYGGPSRAPFMIGTTSTYNPSFLRPPARVKDDLPWLYSVTKPNKKIDILGGEYEIGDDKFFYTHQNCTSTPRNNTEVGICSLLSVCPEVFVYLTDFQAFAKYACIIDNKYAGVCCPKPDPYKV